MKLPQNMVGTRCCASVLIIVLWVAFGLVLSLIHI